MSSWEIVTCTQLQFFKNSIHKNSNKNEIEHFSFLNVCGFFESPKRIPRIFPKRNMFGFPTAPPKVYVQKGGLKIKNFDKMKKLPRSIQPSNKCAKFHVNVTILCFPSLYQSGHRQTD